MHGGFILIAFFQQEQGQYFGQKLQKRDLILGPHTIDGALVKAHIAAEYTAVHNGALKHTLDVLWLQYGAEMGSQGGDIGAVKHTAFVKYLGPAGDVGNVADVLQGLDFRGNALIAPFKRVAAGGADGMKSMDQSILELYQAGKITRETALDYADNYDQMLRRIG